MSIRPLNLVFTYAYIVSYLMLWHLNIQLADLLLLMLAYYHLYQAIFLFSIQRDHYKISSTFQRHLQVFQSELMLAYIS
jgi:hypothetical protein